MYAVGITTHHALPVCRMNEGVELTDSDIQTMPTFTKPSTHSWPMALPPAPNQSEKCANSAAHPLGINGKLPRTSSSAWRRVRITLGAVPLLEICGWWHLAEALRIRHVSWACGTQGVPLKKCAVCSEARYCGAGCQKTHWKIHKADCHKL